MAGPPANRVRQSYGSAPATPRERAYVSRAAADPPESAPPAGCTRKSRPDPGIDRASSPSRRITAGKVNHRPFALASFFSKLLGANASGESNHMNLATSASSDIAAGTRQGNHSRQMILVQHAPTTNATIQHEARTGRAACGRVHPGEGLRTRSARTRA